MQRDKLGSSSVAWAGIDGASVGAQGERDGFSTVPPRGSEVGLVMAEVDTALATCLVLEDDAVLRRLLSRHLSNRGFKVTAVQNLAEARAALAERSFGFILSDSMLPDGSGLDLLPELADTHVDTAVLVMSGDKRAERARFGAGPKTTAFLLKPFSMQSLDTNLAALEGTRRLEKIARRGADLERVERFRTRFAPELGRDAHALGALDALAGLRCPVLLVGGDVGLLRLCARALHEASAGPQHAFVTLDGAVLETTAEFDARLGAVETGTLAIEQVERMPLLVQARLVSLLADGEVERPGERERLRLKPRLVATLGGERDALVLQGKLHPDLALLLGRLQIHVLPRAEGLP